MIARLSLAATAALLSTLVMSVPVRAADANAGYAGPFAEVESVEIVRADTRYGRYHDDWRHDDWRGGRDRHFAHRPRHLEPWQVRGELRRRGFRAIHFLDRRVPVYKLRAIGPRGHRVFLVVSSRNGNIIDRRPVGRGYWR